MLENHGGEFPYRMTELYEKIGLNPSNYKRWIKSNLLEIFEEGYDFMVLVIMTSTKGGQHRQDYKLTRRAAEEIAILAKTPQGKALRKWLLDIKDAIGNYDYLTLEQVYFLIDLVNAFSFVTHQKAIEMAHLNAFIDKNGKISGDKIYAQFHNSRNKALNIEPETIKERILRYYDEENRLVDKTRKREILAIIDKYALIGNAAFDFMSAIGRPTEISLKVGKIVKEMADRMNAEIRPKNEPDLFHEDVVRINQEMILTIS